jgi:quinol monooxygenase YgiN
MLTAQIYLRDTVMSEVSAVAVTVAKAEHRERVAEALEALLAPTHKEVGMLQYEMFQDSTDSRCFVFIERWSDLASFNAHCKSEHVNAYLNTVKDWVDDNKLFVLTKAK